MFTGIVEEVGKVISFNLQGNSGKINIFCKKVLEDTKIGDSIAVNGICLTVVSIKENGFVADVMVETVNRSCLKTLNVGDAINLERAMSLKDRFGGHIVSGHIDGVGKIASLTRKENAILIEIETKEDILKYIVNKGSIAIDGISLTVASLTETSFIVSVIPHTLEDTTLSKKNVGDLVNLENDVIGKYVERLLTFKKEEKTNLTFEFLKEHGF